MSVLCGVYWIQIRMRILAMEEVTSHHGRYTQAVHSEISPTMEYGQCCSSKLALAFVLLGFEVLLSSSVSVRNPTLSLSHSWLK